MFSNRSDLTQRNQLKASRTKPSNGKSPTAGLAFRTKSPEAPSRPPKRRHIIDLTSDDPSEPSSPKKARYEESGEDSSRRDDAPEGSRSRIAEHSRPKKQKQKQSRHQTTNTDRQEAPTSLPRISVVIPTKVPYESQAKETLTHEGRKARRRFKRHLEALGTPAITLHNDIDGTTPPIDFKFVNQSILGEGVTKASEDFMIGCDCRAENGRNCGCEYTYCLCLGDAAEKDGRKVFPYSMGRNDKACLRNFYLTSRWHIYECNQNCNCRDNCKNRVVQFGRKVEFQIFKTQNRGWGLRCLQPLQKGQFVDTYRGEIITSEEADLRGETRNPDEGNYFMDLDKFVEPEAITKSDFLDLHPNKLQWHKSKVRAGEWAIEPTPDGDDELWLNPGFGPHKYVCDGMHVGGPTRFINHSCDPNLQVHTASFNHADTDVYELAFFAKSDIPAGTELTFDYKDEDARDVITEEAAEEVERKMGYRPAKCLCGAEGCRGYFFT